MRGLDAGMNDRRTKALDFRSLEDRVECRRAVTNVVPGCRRNLGPDDLEPPRFHEGVRLGSHSWIRSGLCANSTSHFGGVLGIKIQYPNRAASGDEASRVSKTDAVCTSGDNHVFAVKSHGSDCTHVAAHNRNSEGSMTLEHFFTYTGRVGDRSSVELCE